MNRKPTSAAARILDVPGTSYHAEARLVTWHPTGIFDDPLADRMVAFIESKEQILGKPFHRFTDLTGLERIDLSLNHVFDIAQDRTRSYRGAPVKSAFFAVHLVSTTIARMYQELMQDSRILVGVFRERMAAAAWLGVPEAPLHPPAPSPR